MANNYLSDRGPSFRKETIKLKPIPAYTFSKTLADEFKAKEITKSEVSDLYESMLVIREFEDMINKCRTGAYEVISDYNYRGPTHLSIGQEATASGVCSMLNITDLITSTHRGHGDSIAKGFHAIKQMTEQELRERCPEFSSLSGEELREAVMEDHIFRTIAELFGKEDGYGKGRGGGMHIADFRVGHLGANAIVGGGIPIATGAAMTCRIDDNMKGRVVCSFAGDGAYSNGVVLESLNWASQDQFDGPLAETKFGLPIIYCLINNHYGMTGRADGEVTGVEPQFFIDSEVQYDGLTRLIVTQDMTERKTRMIELGDAFIAFPGGTGTLEEIAEVMSKVSLGHLDAPCILYDLDGYYAGLKALLAHMVEMGLSSPERQSGIYFVKNLDEIKSILKRA